MSKNMKKRRYSNTIRLLLTLCVVVMFVTGYIYIKDYLDYKKGTDAYADLEQYVMVTAPSPSVPTPSSTPQISPATTQTGQPDPDDMPKSTRDDWPVVDFGALAEINSGIAAWIYLPGTNINYPVVHGTDNDFYLSHLFNKTPAKPGAIFIDYRNAPGFQERNTIIYGHHMRDKSMFWSIAQYKDQIFYDEHPVILLVTPEGNFEVVLFAGRVVDTDSNAWRRSFSGDDDFMAWIDDLYANSTFTTDVVVNPTDRVISLSTCTYEFSDARYVLYGVLLEETATE